MSKSRTMIAGVAAVVAYLVSAAITGRLSPLGRLPLLDGVHTAPPYNWVAPPPELAPQNQAPRPAEEKVPLGDNGTNGQTIVSTGDQQLSISMPARAVAPLSGKTSAGIKIEPLDSATFAAPPKGLLIRGNTYRIALRYNPGGQAIPPLERPGRITMLYPAPTPELLGAKTVMLFSRDGQSWREIKSEFVDVAQQVTADFTESGYYVAAAVEPEDAPGSKSFPSLLVIGSVAGLATVTGVFFRLQRVREEEKARQKRRAELARRSRSTKRR